MKTYAGTPYFMAPEVLDGDYTHKCDIWSLACVLYMLMGGELPYGGTSRNEVFTKIKAADYKEQDHFSDELKSLLRQMFTINPTNRPTAYECGTHAWFQKMLAAENAEEEDPVLSEQIFNKLQQFHGKNRLRRECL